MHGRSLKLPSFAAEVRRELASRSSGGLRRGGRAELAGLVDACGELDADGATLKTLSAAVARSAVRLFRGVLSLDSTLTPAESDRFGRPVYAVRAAGEQAVRAVEGLRTERLARDSASRTAYLSGAFQGCGSVAGPGGRGGHHLEFVHRDREFIERVAAFSRAPLRIVRRRGRWVAYTKSADGVTTVLSQLGLHDAVLQYEARAIVGEAKANANRVTNFDSANAGRTAQAAAKQQRALESLDGENLPEALAEMLSLRLEHPDASLTELARLSGLSRSAVNHRLRRLVALAESRER